MEPTWLLRTLDPCAHLRRFLRLFTTHYKRNIRELRPYTTQQVRAAMLNLSSSQVHPDLESVFRIIENGGRKQRIQRVVARKRANKGKKRKLREEAENDDEQPASQVENEGGDGGSGGDDHDG
ncbi:hypothetical protein B0H14DRAFT_2585527 [Mycena olivaceomarginata]|nr:hypothetical protein B0H14DRAFT_2585527 [Mycena olivaceomarginata]